MAPPRNSDHDEHIKQRQMIQLHQLLLHQQHQQQLIAQQQQQLLLQQQQQQSVAASMPSHLVHSNALPLTNALPLSNSSIFDMGNLNISPEVSNMGSDAFAKLLSGQNLPEKQESERAVDPISSLLEQLKVREREDKQKQQMAEQQKQMQLQEQQKQQHLADQQKQLQLQEQQKLLQEAQKMKEQHQLKERMLRDQQQKLREQQELQAVADQIMQEDARANELEYNHAASRREESTPVSSDFGDAQGSELSFKEEISPEEVSTFQVPKSSEKRKGKNKKAEEKKKAKQASAASEKPYIPGMPGSVPPLEVEESQTSVEEFETASFESEKVTGMNSLNKFSMLSDTIFRYTLRRTVGIYLLCRFSEKLFLFIKLY